MGGWCTYSYGLGSYGIPCNFKASAGHEDSELDGGSSNRFPGACPVPNGSNDTTVWNDTIQASFKVGQTVKILGNSGSHSSHLGKVSYCEGTPGGDLQEF